MTRPNPEPARLVGRVLSFDPLRAHGLIVSDEGRRWFVHRRDVHNYPTLLQPGERVSFAPTDEPKGPRARLVWRANEEGPLSSPLGEIAACGR